MDFTTQGDGSSSCPCSKSANRHRHLSRHGLKQQPECQQSRLQCTQSHRHLGWSLPLLLGLLMLGSPACMAAAQVTRLTSTMGLTLSEISAQRVIAAMIQGEQAGNVWAPLVDFASLAANKDTAIQSRAPQMDRSSKDQLKSLVQCINDKYEPKNMTWKVAMQDELASVKIAGAWWTVKKRQVAMTLVTQSTVDRIPQLYSQCKSWRGPVSVILYQALVQDKLDELSPQNKAIMRNAIMQVSDFFEDVEKDPEACKPDILLAYELFTESKAVMLYPINLLRNLARLQARTPILALADVDMLLSRDIFEVMLDEKKSEAMVKELRDNSVYVMPAFETYGVQHEAAALADVLVTQDKAFLAAAVKKGIVAPFDSRRFIWGHNCTNFARWYKDDKQYEIKYGERYEPWVITDRSNVPWHDVRFRGYGNNKIQQIAHINSTNFRFVVLPTAFIIHRCHKETSARHRLISSKIAFDKAVARKKAVDKTSVYGHTRTMFDIAKEQMNQGKFRAVIDPATLHCRSVLSWWSHKAL